MRSSILGLVFVAVMGFGCGGEAMSVDDASVPDSGVDGGDAGDLDGGSDSGMEFSVTPQIVAGDRQVCYLFADGRVKCWGETDSSMSIASRLGNEPGEMGANLPFVDFGEDAHVVQIEAGSQAQCAIFESDELKCWGANQFGQLGNESNQRLSPGPELPAVDLGVGRHAIDVSSRMESYLRRPR